MVITTVSIGGVTDYVISEMTVTNDLSGRNSTAEILVFIVSSGFVYDGDDSLYDAATYGDPIPRDLDEIIVTNSDGAKVFGGFVTSVSRERIDRNGVLYKLSAKDYNLLLETTLASSLHTSVSDRVIMQTEFGANLPEIDTSSANLEIIQSSIDTFDAENLSFAEMMRRLVDLTGGEYRVNYDKELHYFTPGNNLAAFQLSDRPHGENLLQFSEEFGVVSLSPSTSFGTVAAGINWTDPTNAFSSDDLRAVYNTTTQDDLIVTAYSNVVPSRATILGIEVIVEGNGTSGTAAQRQIQLGLTKDGSALAGSRNTGVQLPQTTDAEVTSGTPTFLWGTTWTPAELNASTFGIMLRDNDVTAAALNIDAVTVKVYYRLWNPTNVTIADNDHASPGPKRAVLADKLKETTGTGFHYVAQALASGSVTSGQPYTFSCFVRSSERTVVVLRLDGTEAYFDLSTGTVGTTDGLITGTSIEALEDGYYRCSATALAVATSMAVEIGCAQADNVSSYTGTLDSGLHVWGAQVTQASTVERYGLTRKVAAVRAEHYKFIDFTSQFFNPANSIQVRGTTDSGGTEIVVTRTDPVSISTYSRTMEAVITNRTIKNIVVAELYGDVQLLQRANPQQRGSLEMDVDGLEVGQQVKITNSAHNLDQDPFTIRRVVHKQDGPSTTSYKIDVGPVKSDLIRLVQQINRVAVPDPEFPTATPPPLSVGSDELQTDAVIALKIAAGAVEEAKLAVGAVTESILGAAAVTTTKIGPDAVTTPKIVAGAVKAAQIDAGAIVAGKIAAGVITGVEIQAGSITAIDAVFATGAIISADIGTAEIKTANINALAVTTAKIDALAVTNAKINTLQASKITAGSIAADVAVLGTVVAAQIQSGSIAADVAVLGTVQASQIQAGSIAASVAVLGTVVASQIQAGTITSVNIAAGTYTLTSGVEAMTINGTSGFKQSNSAFAQSISLFGGGFSLDHNINSNRVSAENDLMLFRNDANNIVIRLANDATDLGQADSGYIAVSDSSSRNKVELGCPSGGEGQILLRERGTGTSVEINLQARAIDNGGNSIVVANESGTERFKVGVTTTGSSLALLGGTSTVSLLSSTTASLEGLWVGSNRVVTVQGAAVTDPTGGGTVDAEARTAIIALNARLKAHGLLA